MALKISFSGKSTKEVSEDEAARITERLKAVMPPNHRKNRVREMIRDGLELRRLGDALESDVYGAERSDLESAFYSMADKIRIETAALVESNRQRSSRVTFVNSTAEAESAREGVESIGVSQSAQELMIVGKANEKKYPRLHSMVVTVNPKSDKPKRDMNKGKANDGNINPR